jgi:hypothetical protein
VIKVGGLDFDAEQLQIEKELIFVVYEVFEVVEQHRDQLLALTRKQGRSPAGEVRIRNLLEAIPDVIEVYPHAVAGFFNSAAMINRQLPEIREVGEPVRLHREKGCAKPGKRFEQVTEQIAHALRAVEGPPLQPLWRDKRNHMVGPIDLLLNLIKYCE